MPHYMRVGQTFGWMCVALVAWIALASPARAADPNGTWKWNFATPDGQEIPLSLELQFADAKLTGKIAHDGQTTDISNGMFSDDQLAFDVEREQDGNKITAHFKGTVLGDSIQGKIEVLIGEERLTFDWNATREKT